jgi:formylglycine-generating enzyme required for sulfatase activity
VHEVSIPFDFYLGRYPVTQQQFAVWTEYAKINHKNRFLGNNHPAENMDWQQAVAFACWATGRHRLVGAEDSDLTEDFCCALPSEAQWEYACSAWQEIPVSNGAKRRAYTEYHTGDGEVALGVAGWYSGNSESTTHPVGQKQSNRYGLYDMHGNVNEWCADVWDAHAYSRRPGTIEDPIVNSGDGANRVLRGGTWGLYADSCRAAWRGWAVPDFRGRSHGFRVGLFPVQSCQTEQPAK